MSNLKSIAEKWIAGEIDAGEYIACLVNRIDTLEGLEIPAAHRAEWEQSKREASRIGAMCKSEDDCISEGLNFGSYERGVMDAINAIASMSYDVANATMEYKEPTNE